MNSKFGYKHFYQNCKLISTIARRLTDLIKCSNETGAPQPPFPTQELCSFLSPTQSD